MFKVMNLSAAHISVEGKNLAPNGYLNVDTIDHHLRYLEAKKAVKISYIPDPPHVPHVIIKPAPPMVIVPETVAVEKYEQTMKRKYIRKGDS